MGHLKAMITERDIEEAKWVATTPAWLRFHSDEARGEAPQVRVSLSSLTSVGVRLFVVAVCCYRDCYRILILSGRLAPCVL